MSLAARYEIRPERSATSGAASLSLAAHALLIAAVLYPWSIAVNAPLPVIEVTLITVNPENPIRQAATTSPRPPQPASAVSALPAGALESEVFPGPPTKPTPPVIERVSAPAEITSAPLPSPVTLPRRNPVSTPLVTASAKDQPLPPQQDEHRAREFAALAAKMAGPSEPAGHGPIVDAGLVAGLQPEYPIIARRRGYQGRVVVAATVLPSGEVEFASLVASSGYDLLDHAALDAVRTWRLLPARKDGEAVDGRIEIPFDFVLQ